MADPVHDLQVRVVLADVDDEAHEVARLAVEAEGVQCPEAEGRVADPAEAVVPVALAPRRLRQRGGGGGDDRAGRRVGEALEDEGRALQVDPPGVVGEVAVAQPFAPELFGRVDSLQRLGGAARAAEVAVTPGHGAEAGLVFAQGDVAASRALVELEVHVAGQHQLSPVAAGGARFAELTAVPVRPLEAVAEARQALHLHLDLAVDAGHRPQQRAVVLVRGLGSPAAGVAAGGSPVGDRQRVLDHNPAGLGDPGRLDHQRAGHVAAANRDDHALRPQQHVTGPAIK